MHQPLLAFAKLLPLAALVAFGMPVNASAQTCGDTFTDTGGPDGDYSSNEDYTVTYCPTAGSGDLVTATFTAFDTEGLFDGLSVFEGNSTDGTELAVLSGRDLDVGSFTSFSEDGCLTFAFFSDGSVVGAGWVADITCDPRPACRAPSNVEIGDLTAESITVGFEILGDITTVVAELGAPGFTPGNGDAIAIDTLTAADAGEVVFADLPPSTAYEVYLYTNCDADGSGGTGLSAFVGPINVSTRATPPSYDACDTPIAITQVDEDVDCGAVALTSIGATASEEVESAFLPYNDVFVSFVATSENLAFVYTPVESPDFTLFAFEVLTACDGELLGTFVTDEAGVPFRTNLSLVIGETYVARAITADDDGDFVDANFDLCLRGFTPVAGDECDTAIEVPVVADRAACSPTDLTTVGALEGVGDDDCFDNDIDIYVSFVATSEYIRMDFQDPSTDTALLGFSIAIFEECGTAPVYCGTGFVNVGTGTASLLPVLDAPLTVGETYVVRVLAATGFSFFGPIYGNADFSLCISAYELPAAPSNDECESPIILVDSAGLVTAASAATYETFGGSRTASIDAAACGGFTGDADDDLFFTVTIPQPGDSVTVTAIGDDDLTMVVFEEDACTTTAPVQVTCSDVGLEGESESVTLGAETAGTTYLIQVYSYYDDTRLPFTVTATADIVSGIGGGAKAADFAVYPNPLPASASLSVVLPEELSRTGVTLTVADLAGRPIARQRTAVGESTVSLGSEQLAAGVYLVTAEAEGRRSTQRVVVQ